MKKTLISTILAATMLVSSIACCAAGPWESPRYIPADEYKTPWTEANNPYYTYYAPWLRQLHLMTKTEAANNKEAGIVGGEACQQITQLAISPVDSDIMYFCSDTSGVYKTTNGGEHWYNVTNNAAGHDARGLLCDKLDKDTVYVYMTKVGVHRSTDGGYTWEQIVADTDRTRNANFRSNTIVQDDAGNTYMCVGSGVWKLDRATGTVTNLTASSCPELGAIENPNDTAEFLDMAVSPDGQIIYACCAVAGSSDSTNENVETGLYISTDGGSTWEICQSASDGSTYSGISTVAIDPNDATCNTVYVGMRITAAGEYKLYKLTNKGKTYTEVFRPANSHGDNKCFYGLKFGPKDDISGIYPLYLHLDGTIYPLRVSYDYAYSNPSFSEVYSATDNIGKDTIRETYTGWNYQAFAPDMKTPGRVVFASSGVYEKSPGGTVKRISSGYSGASLRDIVFNSENKMIAPAVDTGLYKADGAYTEENTTPTFTKNTDTLYATRALIDPNKDDHIFVFSGKSNGGTNRRIQESTDGGATFTVEAATDAVLDTANGEINATVLCYDNEDSNIIYSSYHNSDDNGETWTANEYFILDVHPDDTKLQVGISGWGESAVLYKTTNGGTSWDYVMDLGFSDITDADFDLNNQNYVWITREIHNKKNAFVRIDLSTGTLTDYTDKFDYKAFRQVEINPKDPNHMLVTSYPGRILDDMKYDFKLSESYDGGETWHTVHGLWGGEFHNIIFSPTTDEVFITGHAGTIIYDYEMFNYYQVVGLRYEGSVVKTTLPRVNAAGGNKVNNGRYIVAPEDVFTPASKVLTGWVYNGTTYAPGELIAVPQ